MQIKEIDKVWEHHIEKIMDNLGLKEKPLFLYGEDASEYTKRYGKGVRANKNTYGAFFCQDMPEEFGKNGVVCIFKRSIGTLAHELCHVKQHQEGSKWFKPGFLLRVRYKIGYYYYPTEIEAFTYAEMYLRKEELYDEVKAYQKRKRRLIFQHNLLYALMFLFLGIIVGRHLL